MMWVSIAHSDDTYTVKHTSYPVWSKRYTKAELLKLAEDKYVAGVTLKNGTVKAYLRSQDFLDYMNTRSKLTGTPLMFYRAVRKNTRYITKLQNDEEDRDGTYILCEVLTTQEHIKKLEIPSFVDEVHPYDIKNNLPELEQLILNENLLCIYERAFANTNITNLIVPNSVVRIGVRAFNNCKHLKTIRFGTNLKSIGDSAFENCCQLKEVVFPENLLGIDNNAFNGCNSLQKVIIPKSTEFIGIEAFTSESLESVTILNDDIQLWDAFHNCPNLKEIYLPMEFIRKAKSNIKQCSWWKKVKPIE